VKNYKQLSAKNLNYLCRSSALVCTHFVVWYVFSSVKALAAHSNGFYSGGGFVYLWCNSFASAHIYIFHLTVSYIKCKNKNMQYVQSSLTFCGFVLCGFAKSQGNPKNETKTKFPEHSRKF